MNLAETARLLTMCAAFDRRTIGEADAHAWHIVLGHLDYDTCRAAVGIYYADATRPAMPADIKRLAVRRTDTPHHTGHNLITLDQYGRDTFDHERTIGIAQAKARKEGKS